MHVMAIQEVGNREAKEIKAHAASETVIRVNMSKTELLDKTSF